MVVGCVGEGAEVGGERGEDFCGDVLLRVPKCQCLA